jgi:hypothetical protein
MPGAEYLDKTPVASALKQMYPLCHAAERLASKEIAI